MRMQKKTEQKPQTTTLRLAFQFDEFAHDKHHFQFHTFDFVNGDFIMLMILISHQFTISSTWNCAIYYCKLRDLEIILFYLFKTASIQMKCYVNRCYEIITQKQIADV